MRFVKAGLCLGLLGMNNLVAQAANTDLARHGAIPVKIEVIAVQAGTTVTWQHASDARIDDELLGSLDIVSIFPTAQGHWLLYVEGNTSPRQRGVSSLLPEANHDAATAVDRDDRGQLQVSALHYLRYLGNNALVVGLINPAGPLDNSDIANNETSQFLADTLVNNPTIPFPDYALGLVYFHKPDYNTLDVTLLLSSSNGLGDNPNRSYSELVDVTARGKGVFAVTEVVWKQPGHNWRGGVWIQTANNLYLDGSGRTADNYGVYLNSDHQYGQYRLNVRLGLANPDVSEAAQFIGLAMDRAMGKNHAGLGYTYTFVSNQAGAGKSDRVQVELYFRFDLAENLSITPSIQRIQNSGFDNTGTMSDSDVNVISVRSSYTF